MTVGYIFYADRSGQFEKHKSWVNSVDNNKEDIVVSTSENELLLWDKRKCIDRLVGHSDIIVTVAFSHSGQKIVSGSFDKSVKVWLLGQKKAVKTLNGHTEIVKKVEFSTTDKYIISTAYDNKLIIWDWVNAIVVKEFNIKDTKFSISKFNILAYVDTASNLRLFDINTLTDVKTVAHNCAAPHFHPNGKVIAVQLKDRNINFIDIESGKLLSTSTHYGFFKFTPDGNFLINGNDENIEIWDWRQNKLVRTLQDHDLRSDGLIEDFTFNGKDQLISFK